MSGLERKYEAIVIGTSAGGLQALSVLFERIPAAYPIPIIVVQHRSKDSRYLLEEVLQSKCAITIKQADEKEHVHSGMIYIAPPDYHLFIETDKTFSLSTDRPVCFSRPSINILFESAAIAYRDKLLGIILTGTNDDGAAGIRTIGQHDGLTIAQNPSEAQFPFMVEASIKTRQVHYIWSLATIRNYLLKLPEIHAKI